MKLRPRRSRTIVFVFSALTFLASCGGPSEAEKEACRRVLALDLAQVTSGWLVSTPGALSLRDSNPQFVELSDELEDIENDVHEVARLPGEIETLVNRVLQEFSPAAMLKTVGDTYAAGSEAAAQAAKRELTEAVKELESACRAIA